MEAFAPVVYEPLDARLRAAALQQRERNDIERAQGRLPREPLVLVVDAVDVYQLDSTAGRRRIAGGYHLLVGAEYHWPATPGWAPDLRLRLIRGMAKANTAAWLLFFDELGYEPDILLSDSAETIFNAYQRYFDPLRTTFIPSLWHMRQALENVLWREPSLREVTSRGRRFAPALDKHLNVLADRRTTLASEDSLEAWWNDLEALIQHAGGPADALRKQRNLYQPRLTGALRHIKENPQVPISTGGLETLIREHVKPVIENRSHAFANIERTNRLFDLVVARHQHALDNTMRVARLLRTDALEHEGWSHMLKQIDDPQGPTRYSSLRDASLVDDLARERKLV